MAIRKELIDELMATSEGPLIDRNGLSKELMKALVERMLGGELTHHLGYERHDVAGNGTGNSRNGKSKKTLKSESGEVIIDVPRDRNGTFEPQLIGKHQTRFEGFDEKILSMYALGMTVRDIQGHLQDMYGVEVSSGLISTVTDSIMDEVRIWQERPLEALYPIVYLDALMVKMRQDGKVDNRAVYTAIGINMEGEKSVLGLWVSGNEGAKYWMTVLVNLKNRGVKDIFLVCTDRLERLSRGHRGGVPGDARADLHRAHDPCQPQVRQLEGAQGHGCGSQDHLPGDERGNGLAGTTGISPQVLQTRRGRRCLGAQLAAHHPLLRIPRRNPQDRLHDQCGRIPAHAAAQSDEESRVISDPGSRDQTDLPGRQERVEKLGVRPRVVRRSSPVHHPMARANRTGPCSLKSNPFLGRQRQKPIPHLHKPVDTPSRTYGDLAGPTAPI